jgi:uncharacterized SAM-binding protein YcdF (DUF218 family)
MKRRLLISFAAAAALYTPFLLKDSGNSFSGDCDYLIILGYKLKDNNPDGQLVERINAAADYLKNHKKAFAVAVGGIAHGNTVSEAQVIKENLAALGVEENRILTEEKSKTPFENLKFVCEIIGEHSHKNIEDLTVCLLTSDCHVHRSLMFAKSAGLKNVHSIAVRTHSKRFYSYLREYPLAVDAFFRCAVNKIKKG